MKYLKGTMSLGLNYLPGDKGLIGYSDADYAGDIDDRKSTSGYVFMLSSNTISWYSGKQKAVSVSTSNAEYIALGAAVREALFLKHLFQELGENFEGIVTVYEDNQAALAIARNPVYHSKQKHIDVQHHFIRDELDHGRIHLEYCDSKKNLADIFTKPLPKRRFQSLRARLGLF